MPHSQVTTANLLLRGLSPDDYGLLQPHFQRARVHQRDMLYEKDRPIELVYFPEGGVASIVAEQDGGHEVEVGLFGYEGMSGSAVVLGAVQTPQRCMIQINDSTAMTIPSARLLQACEQSRTLRSLLLLFAQTLSVQAALTAAANAHYTLPQRLARWLLMCHDRVGTDLLDLTHEFISMMLAVRRAGVTVTLQDLELKGAIRSTRALVTVIDRERLETIAGDSYGAAEAEYRRLLGPFGKGEAAQAAA